MDSIVCGFVGMIAAKYVSMRYLPRFLSSRPPIFVLPTILNFQLRLSMEEIRSGATEFLVICSVQGDFSFV